jgi:hypothetical protein
MSYVFQILQPSVSRNPQKYKKNSGCLALVASDGRKSILIDWIGASLAYWLDCVSQEELCSDLGTAPVGISLWEGDLKSNRDYWGEDDQWLEGEFRPLTDEEWESYETNGLVWDPKDFFEDDPEVSSNQAGLDTIVQREQEACEALRHIAAYVSAGGYNAPDPIDIQMFQNKIIDGINYAIDEAVSAKLAMMAVENPVAEESSVCPETT